MRRRDVLSVVALMVAAGCSAGTAPYDPSAGDAGMASAVEATFLSASLSDDCPDRSGESGGAAADCAAPADAGARGPGLVGGCGFCRQTSMQLRFAADPGDGAHTVEVAAVYLLDGRTDARLDTLTARSPTAWDDAQSSYQAWNTRLADGQTLRTSWKLSAPRWNSLGISAFSRNGSQPLRLEVHLRIDGVPRVVRSGELNREAEVAT